MTHPPQNRPQPRTRPDRDAMHNAARGLADAIERSDPDAAAAIDFWQERLRLLVRP